jgi:hypothetical protein
MSVVDDHLLFHEQPSGALFESDGTARGTRVLASVDAWGPVMAAGALAYFGGGYSSFFGGDLELWAVPVASLGACGNGVLDAGETCDDGDDSPTCNADCTLPACGDGWTNRAAGETCDDGANSDDDDCCDSHCTARTANAPCTDRNACTELDTCDGSGQCRSGTVRACDDGDDFTADGCTAEVGCVHGEGCWGDCNGDSAVAVSELVTVVRIALGTAAECRSGVAAAEAVDVVTVIRGVSNALNGCPLS